MIKHLTIFPEMAAAVAGAEISKQVATPEFVTAATPVAQTTVNWVGIIIGLIIVAFVVIVIIFVLYKKKKRQDKNNQKNNKSESKNSGKSGKTNKQNNPTK